MKGRRKVIIVWVALVLLALVAIPATISAAPSSDGTVIYLHAAGTDNVWFKVQNPPAPYHADCVFFGGTGLICDSVGTFWADFGDEGEASGSGMHSWDHRHVAKGKDVAPESKYKKNYVRDDDGEWHSIGYGQMDFGDGDVMFYHVTKGWAEYQPGGPIVIESWYEIVGGEGKFDGATGELYIYNTLPTPDPLIHGWVKLTE